MYKNVINMTNNINEATEAGIEFSVFADELSERTGHLEGLIKKLKKPASGKRRVKQGEKYLLLLSMLKAVLCNSFKKGITNIYLFATI